MSKLRVESFTISLDGFGAGERLSEEGHLPALGYACTRHQSTPLATT